MTAPSNDDLANAIIVPEGLGALGPYVIDDATTQPGEVVARNKSIWFKFFVGQNTAGVAFSTQGSPGGDADSGDSTDPDNPPPFGQLDTVMARYSTTLDNPTLSDLNFEGSNDDSGGGLQSSLVFDVFAPQWYYIQVGVFDSSYTGSIILNYFNVPHAPYDVIEVDDCPVMVESNRRLGSQLYYPSYGSSFGSFSDGYLDWYEPAHQAGELLLWIGIGDKADVSTPAGYTTVLDTFWDSAPTDDPSPRGALAGSHYPVNHAQVHLLIAYRIAAEAQPNLTVASTTVRGTITGIKYSEDSYSISETTSRNKYGNDGFGVAVCSFQLTQMGDDYPQVTNWPANPVKAGTLTNSVYTRELTPDPDTVYPHDPHPFTVTVSETTADHIGNHIWMTLLMQHGPVSSVSRVDGVGHSHTTMDLYDQFIPGGGTSFVINGSSLENGTIFIGDKEYNKITCAPYISNDGYFVPFIPESWVPSHLPTNGTWDSENGFSDTSPARTFSIEGHSGDSGGNWWDSGLGLPYGEDGNRYDWTLTGAGALLQLIIQGPEVHRPINDDRADAYTITDCPIAVAECVFGQTAEPGETYDGLGNARNSSVWFKYIPSTSAIDAIIRTGESASDASLGEFPPFYTEYDTIVVVYDSAMNVLASNDDGDIGDLSIVTLDLAAGETYYIQVTGYGGDEGRLLLTIEGCGDLLPYWGILNALT